jgi:Ca2+-transporting ATPase
LTASKIASDCGILSEGQLVMEGPDFRKLTDEELDAKLPSLRVLARSSPSDKHRLVTRLKYLREVVAVTGDGTYVI